MLTTALGCAGNGTGANAFARGGGDPFNNSGAVFSNPAAPVPAGPRNAPVKGDGTVLFITAGVFSGDSAVDMDSAIDAIRAAKAAGASSLYLTLDPGTEMVSFTPAEDISATGLEITTGNSPAELVIDGRGRIVVKAGTANSGPIITVGPGITLRLKNIGFVGITNNNALLDVQEGGNLILEEERILRAKLAPAPAPISNRI